MRLVNYPGIERRWGKKINARGIYRDPTRSSRSQTVKVSGLRWLSFTIHTPLNAMPLNED